MQLSRNSIIAAALLLLHAGLIAALQNGLLIRAADITIPVEMLSQTIKPPAMIKKPIAQQPVVAPRPPPQLRAVAADPTSAPNAPTGVIAPQPIAAPIAAPVASAAPTVVSAGPAVQLPSSDADYLQNPKPAYPAMSRRLNEQGRSVIKVLIGIDGVPKQADIAKSSGFDRLDQAALSTVMRWHFVPGKRAGVPEAMWFNVPFNWVLG